MFTAVHADMLEKKQNGWTFKSPKLYNKEMKEWREAQAKEKGEKTTTIPKEVTSTSRAAGWRSILQEAKDARDELTAKVASLMELPEPRKYLEFNKNQ